MRRGALVGVALFGLGCPSQVALVDDDASTGPSGNEATGAGDDAAPTPTTMPPTTMPPTTTSTTGPAVTTGPFDDDSTGPGIDGGFIFDGWDDWGGVAFECDLFAQDCPEGEKCMPWANDGGWWWNATRCTPVSPNPRLVGQSCMVEGSALSGIDDCYYALMCWNVDERTGVGICEDMCSGSVQHPYCATDTDTCAFAGGGAISLCLPRCDPLIQNCSASNATCIPVQTHDLTWVCWPDRSGDLGAIGDACEYIDGCDPGLVCLDAPGFSSCGAMGCCTPVCDASDPDSNAACAAIDPMQICEAWYLPGMAPEGYDAVGVCAIPF